MEIRITRCLFTHDNPMPSLDGNIFEGQTIRTYKTTSLMKSVHHRRNSYGGSAVGTTMYHEMIYTPNKYRETEGIEEVKGRYSQTNASLLV